MSVYIYIHTCICVYMYIRIYIHVFIYVYAYTCLSVLVCLSKCIYMSLTPTPFDQVFRTVCYVDDTCEAVIWNLCFSIYR